MNYELLAALNAQYNDVTQAWYRNEVTHKTYAKAVRGLVREWLLDGALLDLITEAYRNWDVHGGREPQLTVGYFVGYFDQASTPRAYGALSTRERHQVVRSALELLRRHEEINASWCIGYGGREARCYEPKEV